MSLFARLKTLRQERKNILDAAGVLLTLAATEKRSLTAEENTQFEARHADGDKMLLEIQRIEKQLDAEVQLGEIRADPRPAGREDTGADGNRPAADDKKVEELERRATKNWMLSGNSGLSPEEMAIVQRRTTVLNPADLPAEVRALSASTGSAGAYQIPQGFVYTLDVALKFYGGIITAADYIDTDNGAVLPYPSINDTANSGEIIAENTAAVTTQDPVYGVTNLNAYMFDSGIILIPIQLLQDSAFNVETYMSDAQKTRLGRRLNSKCTVGTGTNEPTGVVTAATLGVTAASATAITYNELLDLEHSVDPAYRSSDGAGFMFNDSTLKAVKKLVDSSNRPLWIAGGVSEGIQGKRPDTIDGFPYSINQDMASMTTGQKTVLFGALKKYKIRRVKQIQMVRFGERFMDKLQIGFITFQRYDGNLIDAGTHPVKYLVQA